MLWAGSVGAEGGVPGRDVHFFSHEGNTGGSEPKEQWAENATKEGVSL